MKKFVLSLFLFLFFLAAWFGRYQSVELSAIHPSVIQVEVKGGVQNPGVYTLKYGSDVQEAVDSAGGLCDNADISALSMVRELRDGDVVVIALREEEEQKKISLNSASLEELCTLKGIGPVMAQRIIEYRNEQPFTEIEQIMEVKGIGEKMFTAIEEFLCL